MIHEKIFYSTSWNSLSLSLEPARPVRNHRNDPFLSFVVFLLKPQREVLFYASSKAHRVAMREHPCIRSYGLFGGIYPQTPKHPILACRSDDAMIRKMNPSEEIDARGEALDKNFIRMKLEFEAIAEEFIDPQYEAFQIFLVAGKDREIVGITKIVFYFQITFHELVELIHVNVHEELRSEVAERKTHARLGRRETPNHFAQEPANSFVGYASPENLRQDCMIDSRKELSDVALQNPDSLCVVFAFFASERIKTIHRLVRSLVDAAGIRVGNESFIEKRIELAIDSVVEQTVAHRRLVDVARLRVANIERAIRAVPVGTRNEISMQQEDMIHEMQREFLYVGLVPFADDEFRPCLKNVFDARNVVEGSLKLNHV